MLSQGVLFIILALVSVKCRVCKNDFSRLVNWWMVALCLAIWSPLRNLFFT